VVENMKYKALTSFSGVISMCKDEVRELTDIKTPRLIQFNYSSAGFAA
jgi:hypothetical protein